MALDFPSSPTTGQTYTGPGGVVWSWDSAKWVNGASATAVVSSWNTRTGAVTLTTADVTGAGGAPIAAPVFTGDAQAVTATAGDNDTSIATTAFVQASQRYLNYADNSGFSINQRGYTSGTALGAGIYGFDRWKAGAGGCTLTFTASPPSTTVTITAGTLQQVVEGASVAGGNYRLSWAGTAQGRVGAGSYAASPVSISGATAGANLTLEFNTGTLGQVKLEAGTVVTPWFANARRAELANCQRFARVIYASARGSATGAGQVTGCELLFAPMQGTPTYSVISAGTTGNTSGGVLTIESSSSANFEVISAAAGDYYIHTANYFLSADL